jgi:pimeloyl-ACP methyl ester carboxylesterase
MYPGKIKTPYREVISDTGINYNLYEPERTAIKSVIMIYGLTPLGEKDPRIVRFAQTFAKSGFRVIVPVLPGIISIDLCVEDLLKITKLSVELYEKYKEPLGMVAFSAGGGLALTACTENQLLGLIDPILLFGAYYHLEDFWDRVIRISIDQPQNPDELEHWIWIRLALMYRHFQSLPLDADEKNEFQLLFRNYCWELYSVKEEFYFRVLKDIPIEQYFPVVNEDVMDLLSPRGKLQRLRARVMLIHDQDDFAVPPVNSQHIYQELCQRNILLRQEILITRLLSHVSPRTSRSVLDIPKILSIFGELYI